MANKAQIFNMALTLLGQSSISDPNGSGEAEQACRQVDDICRKALLEEHHWNFSLSRAALSQDSTAPAFEYTYAYDLPVDCLRIVKYYNNVNPVREEGLKVLSNASSLNLIYVKNLEDTTRFSPLFVQVLAHDMAMAMEYRVTGQSKMQSVLMEKRRKLLIKAKRTDAQKDQKQNKLKSNRELAMYTRFGDIDK